MHMPRDSFRRRILHQLPRPPGKLLRMQPVPGEQFEQEGGREVHAPYDTAGSVGWDKFLFWCCRGDQAAVRHLSFTGCFGRRRRHSIKPPPTTEIGPFVPVTRWPQVTGLWLRAPRVLGSLDRFILTKTRELETRSHS